MNTKSVALERPGYRDDSEIVICNQVAPHPEALFAMDLMSRISIATAEVDGEDSAGRQKLRLMTPAEVVSRACNLSAAAFAEFERREWLLELPLPKVAKLKHEL